MGNEFDIQVTEAYRTPNNINPIKTTARHIIIKIPEIQHRNSTLKVDRENKQVTFKEKSIRIMADFSLQTITSRRAWSKVLQVGKKKIPTQSDIPCKTLLQV